MLFKSSQKKVLIFLLGTIICTGRCYSQDRDAIILTVPEIEENVLGAGKRVKIYLPEYPEAYYVLFLPYNFTHEKKLPVICEIPANACSYVYNGLPDTTTFLGYGITKGRDWLWVSLPILNSEGNKILQTYFPENPSATIKFWLLVLNDLNKKFNIDKNKIVLSGFSRGAISISYLGNSNDEISSKWAAYFAHAHFDGCCQTIPGNCEERINRMKDKETLIAVGKNDIAHKCSTDAYRKLTNLECPVTYLEIPDIYTDKWENLAHNPFWILEDSEAAEDARNWLKNLFTDD